MPHDPTRFLTRLVLAAMLLIAVAVLFRPFLSPPMPRTQAPGGLKQLALPLWELVAHQEMPEALSAKVPGDAPGADPGRADLTCTYHFATLTEAQAVQLQGRPARFRVEGARDGWDLDDWTIFNAPGGGPVRRTVWLRPGKDVDDPMTVEAVLRVIRHPPRGRFPGYTELRLCGARVVR
jgi:hypothetical protein